ncbi:unnamed protein product, partial [marine sediment metagenome]
YHRSNILYFHHHLKILYFRQSLNILYFEDFWKHCYGEPIELYLIEDEEIITFDDWDKLLDLIFDIRTKKSYRFE